MDRRTFLTTTAAALTPLTVAQAPARGAGSLGSVSSKRAQPNQEVSDARNQNRSTVIAREGMVCTSQPLATMAGVDILKGGGNALDAIICANAMLSVVEPMNCGPGGDLFAIVWIEKERKLYGLNASGRAPYDWNLDKAKGMGLTAIPPYTPLAWNVPGCVSGWACLLERFGTCSPARLFEAAIHYARDGFPVSSVIAGDWRFDASRYPTLAPLFQPEGHAPVYGEVFKNPRIAEFYEGLGRNGLRSFYEGEVADRIVRFSQANGGHFSLRDFTEHSATWVDPATTNYRGYDVWEIPPNGQGISALQILNMLETFDMGALAPNSAEQLHLFIEAKKLAYEDRAVYYADMDFAKVPLAQLISKEYGRARAKLIDPRQACNRVTAGTPGGTDTVYLCAADREGNMVSLIQSIYHGWGSRIVPDNLGFALQNRGESFNLDPSHRNKLEPHKRPFHTIIPAFVTKDGNPLLAVGVMGGDFQPQGHAQVLMNMIDYGMSPQCAGDQPRAEHTGSSTPEGDVMKEGGTVNLESLIPEATKRGLVQLGHNVSDRVDVFGGYQCIRREESPRRYFGGSDPRKDGCSIGY